MIRKIREFVKKEYVLCISAFLAIATMIIVPPDAEYAGYIDFRVLCLLMCLMAVVAGLKSIGVFGLLTTQLLKRTKSGQMLSVSLVMLPFFSSMLVTNDVALIVFVPFTIELLNQLKLRKQIVPVIVLQTVAANLGSMATPVGNPQNLFLYSVYNLSATDFFAVTLPLTFISLVCLVLASIPVLPKNLIIKNNEGENISSKRNLLIFVLLFVLSLLTVFRVVPFQATTAITIIVFLIFDRKRFKEIDFILLATFVCFFIISENLGRVELIRDFLQQLLGRNTLLTSIGASQVISNVPAAVLLSSFTDNWKELLSGVNIGGLGTPIASLASLITLKFYLKSEEAKPLRFLVIFTVANVVGLILLLAFSALI